MPQITSAGVQRQHSGTAGATGRAIPLTCNEIAARFSTLIIKPVTGIQYRLRWPAWCRRQHLAKPCRYRRQAKQTRT
jgi:hypothetical protein